MLADESFRQMERIETIAQSHRVAETALETYHYAVPDKVKPRDSEWTVMAAIVLEDRPRRDFDDELREEEDRELRREPWRGLPWRAGPSVFRTVALATGSKCAGEAAIATAAEKGAAGGMLRDSHAEVLCRRAFMHILYAELRLRLSTISIPSTTTDADAAPTAAATASRLGCAVGNANKDDATFIADSTVQVESNKTSSCAAPSNYSDEKAWTFSQPMDENGRERFLLEEITVPNNDKSGSTSGHRKFCLRSNARLHMYVSEVPCGDASIYRLSQGASNLSPPPSSSTTTTTVNKQVSPQEAPTHTSSSDSDLSCIEVAQQALQPMMNFTGAKLLATPGRAGVEEACVQGEEKKKGDSSTNGGLVEAVREPGAQVLGALRFKSMRSNVPVGRRSASMSCSDKLLRWAVLGMQGSLLSDFLLVSTTLGNDRAGATGISTSPIKRQRQQPAALGGGEESETRMASLRYDALTEAALPCSAHNDGRIRLTSICVSSPPVADDPLGTLPWGSNGCTEEEPSICKNEDIIDAMVLENRDAGTEKDTVVKVGRKRNRRNHGGAVPLAFSVEAVEASLHRAITERANDALKALKNSTLEIKSSQTTAHCRPSASSSSPSYPSSCGVTLGRKLPLPPSVHVVPHEFVHSPAARSRALTEAHKQARKRQASEAKEREAVEKHAAMGPEMTVSDGTKQDAVSSPTTSHGEGENALKRHKGSSCRNNNTNGSSGSSTSVAGGQRGTLSPTGTCLNWAASIPLQMARCRRSRNADSISRSSTQAPGDSTCSKTGLSLEIFDTFAPQSQQQILHEEVHNWQLVGDLEVTVGVIGRRQGASAHSIAPATRSRLCKERFFEQWLTLHALEQQRQQHEQGIGDVGTSRGEEMSGPTNLAVQSQNMKCLESNDEKFDNMGSSGKISHRHSLTFETPAGLTATTQDAQSPLSALTYAQCKERCGVLYGTGRAPLRTSCCGPLLAAWPFANAAFDDFRCTPISSGTCS